MLAEHFNPVREWWDNRQELEDGEKSRAFTPQELIDLQCNFDQCKYPKDEEEILSPKELITNYKQRRKELDAKIDRTLSKIEDMLGIKIEEL